MSAKPHASGDGLAALCRALLRQLELSGHMAPGCRRAAEDLLFGGDGGPIHVLDASPPSPSAPFVAWRLDVSGEADGVRIVVLDLSGDAGEVSLPLPQSLLVRWPANSLFCVSCERTDAQRPCTASPEDRIPSSNPSGSYLAPAAACASGGAIELFSGSELTNGALAVQPAPFGIVSLLILPAHEGDLEEAVPIPESGPVSIPEGERAADSCPVGVLPMRTQLAKEAIVPSTRAHAHRVPRFLPTSGLLRAQHVLSSLNLPAHEPNRAGDDAAALISAQSRGHILQPTSGHLQAHHLLSSLRRLACGGTLVGGAASCDALAVLCRCLRAEMTEGAALFLQLCDHLCSAVARRDGGGERSIEPLSTIEQRSTIEQLSIIEQLSTIEQLSSSGLGARLTASARRMLVCLLSSGMHRAAAVVADEGWMRGTPAGAQSTRREGEARTLGSTAVDAADVHTRVSPAEASTVEGVTETRTMGTAAADESDLHTRVLPAKAWVNEGLTDARAVGATPQERRLETAAADGSDLHTRVSPVLRRAAELMRMAARHAHGCPRVLRGPTAPCLRETDTRCKSEAGAGCRSCSYADGSALPSSSDGLNSNDCSRVPRAACPREADPGRRGCSETLCCDLPAPLVASIPNHFCDTNTTCRDRPHALYFDLPSPSESSTPNDPLSGKGCCGRPSARCSDPPSPSWEGSVPYDLPSDPLGAACGDVEALCSHPPSPLDCRIPNHPLSNKECCGPHALYTDLSAPSEGTFSSDPLSTACGDVEATGVTTRELPRAPSPAVTTSAPSSVACPAKPCTASATSSVACLAEPCTPIQDLTSLRHEGSGDWASEMSRAPSPAVMASALPSVARVTEFCITSAPLACLSEPCTAAQTLIHFPSQHESNCDGAAEAAPKPGASLGEATRASGTPQRGRSTAHAVAADEEVQALCGLMSQAGGRCLAAQALCSDLSQVGGGCSAVFVSPELAGWGAVGGLGVMVDHLSAALARRGVDVTIIVPAYASCPSAILRRATFLCDISVPLYMGKQRQLESLSVLQTYTPAADACPSTASAAPADVYPSTVGAIAPEASDAASRATPPFACASTYTPAADVFPPTNNVPISEASDAATHASPPLAHATASFPDDPNSCGSPSTPFRWSGASTAQMSGCDGAPDRAQHCAPREPRVRVLLLRSDRHFRAPYCHAGSRGQLLTAVLLARGALLAMERLNIKPDVVISNDWVAGLVAPYARHDGWRAGSEGGAWRNTEGGTSRNTEGGTGVGRHDGWRAGSEGGAWRNTEGGPAHNTEGGTGMGRHDKWRAGSEGYRAESTAAAPRDTEGGAGAGRDAPSGRGYGGGYRVASGGDTLCGTGGGAQRNAKGGAPRAIQGGAGAGRKEQRTPRDTDGGADAEREEQSGCRYWAGYRAESDVDAPCGITGRVSCGTERGVAGTGRKEQRTLRDAGWVSGVEREEQSGCEYWAGCAMLHLIHNLEEGYDGSLSLGAESSSLQGLLELHGLPPHLLAHSGPPHSNLDSGLRSRRAEDRALASVDIDCLSVSRAALLCAGTWGTVSTSYRAHLLAGGSPYSPLLRSFSSPFACALGIPLASRRADLAARGMLGIDGHRAARRELRRQCFGEGWREALEGAWGDHQRRPGTSFGAAPAGGVAGHAYPFPRATTAGWGPSHADALPFGITAGGGTAHAGIVPGAATAGGEITHADALPFGIKAGGGTAHAGMPPSGMTAAEATTRADAPPCAHEDADSEDGDSDVPIFAFVGRLAQQKGVHLLLDCIEPFLEATRGRAQILICGCAEPNAYGQRCAAQMAELSRRHPTNVWASDPRVYFEQGLFVSAAADFGVMPSLFEPSGLVGEEFLSAGTPLICADTGGMRDRVRRFDTGGGTGGGQTDTGGGARGGQAETRGAPGRLDTGGGTRDGLADTGGGPCPSFAGCKAGNGLLFTPGDHRSLLGALLQAVAVHRDEGSSLRIRANAHASACDVGHTAYHWHGELLRLRACRTAYPAGQQADGGKWL